MLDTVIRDDRDARYASHVPVLHAWLSGRMCPIVEFGVGRFSTPVLTQYTSSLVCFEKSPTWIREVQQLVPSADIRTVPNLLTDFEQLFAAEITPDHVVFVDGSPGQWRAQAIRVAASRKAQMIIAHDWSETQCGYGYHALGKLPGYTKHAYVHLTAKIRTAVFTRDNVRLPAPSVSDHAPCT